MQWRRLCHSLLKSEPITVDCLVLVLKIDQTNNLKHVLCLYISLQIIKIAFLLHTAYNGI